MNCMRSPVASRRRVSPSTRMPSSVSVAVGTTITRPLPPAGICHSRATCSHTPTRRWRLACGTGSGREKVYASGHIWREDLLMAGSAANQHFLTVDADGHVLEPRDTWQKYLEPKYRADAIR